MRTGRSPAGRGSLVLMAVALVMLAGAPAQATTVGVSIVDFGFSPSGVKASMGSTVQWTNTGTRIHTSTQDSPLALWNTGNISPGSSASTTLTAAGGYRYHCAIHTIMTGSVKVPIAISPGSGTTSTVFDVTVATVPAAAGYAYDVQMKVGSGSWATYRTGVTTATTTFRASASGTYSFRSRIRRTATGAASGYSPARSVVVS